MSVATNDFDSIFIYQSPNLFARTAKASNESSEFVKNNINTIVKCVKIAAMIPGIGLITAGFRFYQAYRFFQMSNNQFEWDEKNDSIEMLMLQGTMQAIGLGVVDAMTEIANFNKVGCLTPPLRPLVVVKCSPAA